MKHPRPRLPNAPTPLSRYRVSIRCAGDVVVDVVVEAMTTARAKTQAFVRLRALDGPTPQEAVAVVFLERCTR